MLTLLLCYISLGIILLFIGPLAEEINNEKIVLKHPQAKKRKLAVNTYLVVFILVCIFLYPIFFYSHYYQKKLNQSDFIRKKMHSRINDNKIYFQHLTGVVELICKECNHSEKIVAFKHGYDAVTNQRCHESGYQCDNCGKYKLLNGFEKVKAILPICECGGNLQRDHPLFCPVCKSTELQFRIGLVT